MPSTPRALSFPAIAAFILAACGGDAPSDGTGAPSAVKLTIAAYTTPREAFGKAILPGFAASWKAKTGQDVTFEESYQGSGAQARAVIDGLEADVVALSLDPDIAKIEKAGLITHDWRSGPSGGIVSRSVVVLAVRPGNPKGIHDWADLTKDGTEVLTPDVKTSGGAMWNVAAIYGAATRGHAGVAAGDPVAAERFLGGVFQHVVVMDKGARESIVNFEKGVGDVAITYENEVIVAKQAGEKMDYVVPSSTILIENPAAVVDAYATKHGTQEVATAFVAYLQGPEAQKAYLEYGLRPADDVNGATSGLPVVTDLFDVRALGGWDKVKADVFADGASYDRALTAQK
jgi:sulfate/thiosulfate-binding protein